MPQYLNSPKAPVARDNGRGKQRIQLEIDESMLDDYPGLMQAPASQQDPPEEEILRGVPLS